MLPVNVVPLSFHRHCAVDLGLILLIDYTAAGQPLFGTAPLSAHVWVFVQPFALAMLLLDERRKAIAPGVFRTHPEKFPSVIA